MSLDAGSDFGQRDLELAAQLQEFARRFVKGSGPLDPVDIVEQAAEAIPRARAAGLTLIQGGRPPKTLAATDPLAEAVDAIQYDTGEGPCLEAIEQNDISASNDLAAEPRWPRFCARAVAETPVRSMFGVRIFLGGDDRGALNFYSTETSAFSELDRGVGAVFSTLASLALQYALERRRSDNLLIALESSRQIGTAMGILMASRLITADEAFEQLRKASQHLHRRVRDVAEEVMETGTLPPMPGRGRPGG
jgi:ANTAR domain-containing protein/GAF domain-containing protein